MSDRKNIPEGLWLRQGLCRQQSLENPGQVAETRERNTTIHQQRQQLEVGLDNITVKTEDLSERLTTELFNDGEQLIQHECQCGEPLDK